MTRDDTPRYPPSDLRPDFESQPLSRQEYITALVQLYRGEMGRSLHWRARMDATLNWSIVCNLGILTFALNNPESAHHTLLAGMYVNLVFLIHEARRLRLFDVYRARVRMVEENVFGPLLRRDPHSPMEGWGDAVAEDLLHPRYKITRWQALRARLVRNYGYIFLLLLITWGGQQLSCTEPWNVEDWIGASLVVGLYAFLLGVTVLTPRVTNPEKGFWKHPDTVGDDVSWLDV